MNTHTADRIPLLDLDVLRTIVAIADTGNFSTAAEVVLRTPSAVSMQVKRVEEILGRQVFLRDSRKVELTADGAALVEHGRRLLALNREVMARFIEPEVVGEVRLGAPDDVAERFLPSMLCRFDHTHPGVVVNVFVESSARMIDMLNRGDLDLAIVTCDAVFKQTEGIETLRTEPLVWATRRGGLAAEKNPVPISVWEEGCAWRAAGLESLREAGRDFRIAFQSAHISGQKAAILADLAIAPIPRSALGGEIVEVTAGAGLPKLPCYALGLSMGAEPSCAVEAAADHLRASFARA